MKTRLKWRVVGHDEDTQCCHCGRELMWGDTVLKDTNGLDGPERVFCNRYCADAFERDPEREAVLD